MHEQSRYVVGVDIGTTAIRCVVGSIDPTTDTPNIVGVGNSPAVGMRKGSVVNLQSLAQSLDDTLGEAERMSGYEIDNATISINGSHIASIKADGMVAVGSSDRLVSVDDVARVEDVAVTGKIPANREVLEVVPHSFCLDGQDNIKDPVGMNGTRLEIVANIVSALSPNLVNLKKAADSAGVSPNKIVPAVLAGSRAVLNDKQMENGVAVIDLGGSTTSLAVFEDGDLQYVGVVPVGGNNITNDLAIKLKVDPETAEVVKLKHSSSVNREKNQTVKIKKDEQNLEFDTDDIDEAVTARLEEIFESVENELKKAGKAEQLPSGVVLIGGGANMQSIADFVRDKLNLAAKVGKPSEMSGLSDKVGQPEFSVALGLMLIDNENMGQKSKKKSDKNNSSGSFMASMNDFIKNIFGKSKS
ncbi:cell division protein FtsA [Candidatus Saccharibacteria bacterium]|nr:MAG: cell division protein FtsA [Candidatus Saccharibacteria bacterium]